MKKLFSGAIAAIIIAIGVTFIVSVHSDTDYVAKNSEASDSVSSWSAVKSSYINSKGAGLSVDGREAEISSSGIYIAEDGTILYSKEAVESAFECAVNVYDGAGVTIVKGSVTVNIDIGSVTMDVNGETVTVTAPVRYIGEVLYIPEEVITNGLGYSGGLDTIALTADFTSENENLSILPSSYSSADCGRLPSVKNQGNFGACWAYAAISAIEANLLPEEDLNLSEEHLIYNHGFGVDGTEGGDQILSIGYLLSWKGPVLEDDDTETVATHVQEIRYIEDKDYEAVKEAIIRYGAVECSVYIATVSNLYVDFNYYNYYRAAYCYSGTDATANHEIIIIGWDDDYPAEYFAGDVQTDGAFICLNSWGSGFGSGGVFYVSYEDALIGTANVVYTKVEYADNYDNIYQYDDTGWTANIGYDRNTSYMANVYTAASDETLAAVGFYATGADTDYKVYIVTDYTGTESLDVSGTVYAEGTLDNSGYYTIDLSEAVELSAGQSFAVIVEINTPGVGKPIACEMDTGTERTSTVTIENKYSYISSRGDDWECTQETLNCNVCLKVYTQDR